MKLKVVTVIIFFLLSIQNSNSENSLENISDIFHIGKMDSHNKNFVLFFKTRQKAILGSLFASVPHFMFLFIMTEIMLKEHHQEQNPQQQLPLTQFTAAEVDANFNEETGTEEDEEEGPLPGQ